MAFSPGTPLGKRAPALLLIATLAVKAVVLAQLHDHPLLQPVGGLDSAAYVDLGRRVASGDWALGKEPFFVAPLYAYFLGLVFALTASSLLAAKVVQILLGTAAAALVFLTARHWFGARAAWIGAGLYALTGVLTFHEVVLLQAALDPFLAALALFLLTRALQRGTPGAYLAAGLAFGGLALNRPNVLAVAGALAVLLLLRRSWRHAAGLACGVALAVAPAMLRNWAVSGEPVLISSHGGLNFYIGNNAEADGTYCNVPGITPNIDGQARDAIRVASGAMGRPASASEASSYFYGRAWSWMVSHPGEAAALFARKLAYLLNGTELALNASYAYYGRDEPTLLRLLVVGPWLLVPLGLLGLVRALRGAPPGYPIFFAFVPVYALSVALFFVSSRYRLPLLVPLAAGAGATLAFFADALRHRRVRQLAFASLALLPLFVLANWDWGLDDGRSEERTAMVVHLVDAGRDSEARALLSRAEAGHPQPGQLYLHAGRAFLERGQALDAVELLRKAEAARPGEPTIALSLGQALLDSGRAAEAAPYLRRALEAGVRLDLASFDLARALAATGARAEAVAALRRFPVSESIDAASLLGVGQLALELEAPDLAESVLSRAAARAPAVAAIRESLGLALALQARPREAIAALQEACQLDARSASARLNLAVVLAEVGRTAEARAQAEEALRLRPDYPQARGLLEALTRRR